MRLRSAGAKIRRQKLLLVLYLATPTLLSAYLLVQTLSHWHSSSSTVEWVEANRAMIQVMVQIVSTILGALQLNAISSALNMSINIRMLSTTASLNELKFWDALCKGKLDWDLRYRPMAILTIYVILLQIPSALWAGAITPVLLTTDVDAELSIPRYSQTTAKYWGYICRPAEAARRCHDRNVTGVIKEMGTFTYLSWKYRTGLLLNSINHSSRHKSSLPQIRKTDNTGYVYHGRSYGVAAGIGLKKPRQTSPARGAKNTKITDFSYYESGYRSNVDCIFNASSALKLESSKTWHDPGSQLDAAAYSATGSLPNGHWPGFPALGFEGGNSTIFAIAASYGKGRYVYGIVSGHIWANFTGIQCEVRFTPDIFQVTVNVASKNISVTPLGDQSGFVDFNNSESLKNVAFSAPSFLSQVLTTGYTSVMETAFWDNIDNVRARQNHTDASKSDILTGVSEAFESLLDHSFGCIGAAQLMLVNDAQTVKANATIKTMQLGEPKYYTYSVFGISMAILLLLGVEAARSRFWRGLGLFNCLDLKSAIVGIVATGDALKILSRWDGDAADHEVGLIDVTIRANKQ